MSSTSSSVRNARLQEMLRPELALVGLMAVIIAMLILPLPTWLVDTLIGLNIATAVVIFLSSFYVERILNFSTFPSVLLFTTLMRLALSVSTSRLILVDADAGHIVSAFGQFVVADNLVVGFVIFAIVTIVQFIVITKGSERIGEVVARFSLDGMPGKQMSIDADLRANAITAEQAQTKRREVEKESQLYGSYDGAMKFVKGDAIAGIVIVFVNLFGGIAVGVLQHGMAFREALGTFTLLTIGDGLVAQIPALLVCISAGFVVTRVSGESKNLGANILGELFSSRIVLAIAAVMVFLLGLLPGFPFLVFLVLSAGLMALCLRAPRRARASGGGESASGGALTAGGEAVGDKQGDWLDKATAETVPLIVLMSGDHLRRWEQENSTQRLKEAFYTQLGIQLPQCAVNAAASDDPHLVRVLINEVPAMSGHIVPGHALITSDQTEVESLQLGVRVSQGNTQALWIPAAKLPSVTALGCETRSDFEEILRLVKDAVLRNITELFGIQETKLMLDQLEKRYPELLKETYRNMPVQRIAEIVQRLLREEISVRNMKTVLETLAQWGAREKDVLLLVEHVRGSLARYISARFARQGRIAALVVAPGTEETFRSGVRQSQGAAYLNLDPARADELLDRIVWHVHEATRSRPDVVLLVAPDIRRFVKRFIETKLPTMQVISFGEISDDIKIDVMRTL